MLTRDELRAAIQSVPVGYLRLRVALNLSRKRQSDVARRIGISQGELSLWVNGEKPIDPAKRAPVAKALGLNMADLFGEEIAA